MDLLCYYYEESTFTYSFQDLKTLGFTWKVDQFNWSAEDLQLLTDTIKKVYQDPNIITTKDYYYYISHHVFDKRITEKQVKHKVLSMLKEITE